MRKNKLVSFALAVALLLSALSFGVKAQNEGSDRIITDQKILQAAQSLINAQSVFYTISSAAVKDYAEEAQPNGTTNVRCYIELKMSLKAERVEDLPYVSGLLNGVGMSSVTECAETALEFTSAMSSVAAFRGAVRIDEDAAAAYSAANFINAVAENIGVVNEMCYAVLLNVSANGAVNGIWGCLEDTVFPLSEYYPDSAAQMYCDGGRLADTFVASAASVTAEIQVATLPTYYRVDARNYANRYTSNATSTYNGSSTKMNPSYYNSQYTYFIDADCANFVSQAIHYGGIPQTATWKPGQYAWHNVAGLLNYFTNTVNLAVAANFANCVAGGFIVTIESGTGTQKHVVMCVQNDTVTHCYSAHTTDVRQAVYTSSYPYNSNQYAAYYNFRNSTTDTQYGNGLLE